MVVWGEFTLTLEDLEAMGVVLEEEHKVKLWYPIFTITFKNF